MIDDDTDLLERARSLIEQVEAPGFGLPVPTHLACDARGTRIALGCRVRRSLDEPPERVVMSVDPDSGALTRVGPQAWTHSSTPAWSGNGRVLAVVARSAGESHGALYITDDPALDSWERHPVAGTVENPCFSPDGRRLLYILAPPDADPAGMAYEVAGTTAGDGAGWEPRVVSTGARLRRTACVLDLDTGRSTTVPTAGHEVWEASWLDDAHLAMLVSEEPGESGWYDPHIVAIDLTSDESATVYRPDGMQLGGLRAHQGKIAFIEAIASDRGIVAGEIVVLDGADVYRAAVRDGAATRLDWLPDGSLSVLGMRGLAVFLGNLRPGRSEVDEAWTSGHGVGLPTSRGPGAGRRLLPGPGRVVRALPHPGAHPRGDRAGFGHVRSPRGDRDVVVVGRHGTGGLAEPVKFSV